MRKMMKGIVAVLAVSALMAGSAFAAEKLAVKGTDGSTTVFSVDETGAASAKRLLVVDESGASTRGIAAYQATSDTKAGVIDFRKMRGAYTASPAAANAVAYSDFIGAFHGWGVDTNGVWRRGATINYYVDGTVASGSVPVALIFSTGTNDDGLANAKAPRFVVGSNGKLSIGNGYVQGTTTGEVVMAQTTGANILDINSDAIRLRQSRAPATSTSACYTGEIAWGTDYVYVCTSGNGTTGAWKRASIAAW